MIQYRILFLSIMLSICNIPYGISQSQDLQFNTKFYDAFDRWVVFSVDENTNKASVGFIYLDEESGPTFYFEGYMDLDKPTLPLTKLLEEASIRKRLETNTSDVAVLSDAQIKNLGLAPLPEWLALYQTKKGTDGYEISRGRWFNAVGASHKAIPILQAIYQKNPHADGLEFELAFAYNATNSFYKAVVILNEAIKHDPSNFWYYRELGYAYKYLDNINEAEKMYKKGISLTKNKYQQAEMAVNMLQGYFHKMDKVKYEEWKSLLIQYAEPGVIFLEYIKLFDDNWGKHKAEGSSNPVN
ncbi:tetratricopeptide repeat protein [Sphingobacterium sp. HJSM2_6]|uniref:tetratricopeptide repeat protein n=1 Tax=Sphingobacterium sp. HJSM2_6 TaxID=3366264 RepID=UPI003BE4E0D0